MRLTDSAQRPVQVRWRGRPESLPNRVGQASRLTCVPGDAGAMPRTAGYWVIADLPEQIFLTPWAEAG